MLTENLSTLKIHKLTKAQYDRESAAGRLDENALYLTPDENLDLAEYATKEYVAEYIEQTIVEMRNNADDSLASMVVDLYPTLKENGSLIPAGTRIHYNNILYRAAVDLWDTAENNPDNAPALWEEINYREGYRIIPETISVGTAFAKDERGWWNDQLYVSLIDNNVWTPTAYPAGWQLA